MAIARRVLVTMHCLWLVVVVISCIGFTVDALAIISTSAASASAVVVALSPFLLLFFTMAWLVLVVYLYGSLCTLTNHVPARWPFSGVYALHDRIFGHADIGAPSTITLAIETIISLPVVLIEFWVYLFFQMPSWWNKWMLRGVPDWIVVPYVILACTVMTVGWLTLFAWLCVRTIKAFWSVRTTLNDIASEDEKQGLAAYRDNDSSSETISASGDTEKESIAVYEA